MDPVTYDTAFYKLEQRTALASANIVLPSVLEMTRARSVVDVGCGTGAWLHVARGHGCGVTGYDTYDGPMLIDSEEYVRANISEGVPCAGYDLAICLEVGEHLPESSAPKLVAGLCQARYVLFSAAIPGQGGVQHINEQWGSWWARLFAEHGYEGSSDLRWQFWTDRAVADWYRQNMLIFAEDLQRAQLRPGVIDVVHPERLGNW